jgi:hypothetical protein
MLCWIQCRRIRNFRKIFGLDIVELRVTITAMMIDEHMFLRESQLEMERLWKTQKLKA